MELIDAHDAREREFAASLQGIDLAASTSQPRQGHRPGHTSNATVVGLSSFYRPWFEQQAGVAS